MQNRDYYNELFYLLSNLIANNILIKKTSLNYFLDGQIIEPNRIKKVNNKVKKVLFKIKLSDYEYLFFKDYPLNILLSLGFVIGDKEDVFKVIIKNNIIYYTNEESIQYIEEEILKILPINLLSLYNRKFYFTLKQPKIITSLKKYVLEKKGIKLHKIFLIKGKGFRMFCPNKYLADFNLATKINIPLVPYIDRNFIRDSHIHLKDYDYIIKLIEPYTVIEETEKILIEKKTKKEILRDISREYYIKLNIERLARLISETICLNFNKIKIILKLNNSISLRISKPKGTFELPIWRCNLDKLLTFNNIEKFEEYSGIKFENLESFKDIFFICSDGKKANYEEKFIREEIINFNNFIDKRIYFKNYEELFIKLLYADYKKKRIEKIIFEEEIPKNLLLIFKNICKKLINRFILKIIGYNKKPNKEFEKNLLTEYLESSKNHILFMIEKIKQGDSRKESLKVTLHKIDLLKKHTDSFSYNETYKLGELIIALLEFLELYDNIASKKLKEKLNDFFNSNITLRKAYINLELEKSIENLFKFSSNKFRFYFKNLLLKRIYFFNNKSIDINLEELKQIKKVNKYKIFCEFPKNYNKIIQLLNKTCKNENIKNNFNNINNLNNYNLNELNNFEEIDKSINLEDTENIYIKNNLLIIGKLKFEIKEDYFKYYRYNNELQQVYEDSNMIIFKYIRINKNK